MTFIITAGI